MRAAEKECWVVQDGDAQVKIGRGYTSLYLEITKCEFNVRSELSPALVRSICTGKIDLS